MVSNKYPYDHKYFRKPWLERLIGLFIILVLALILLGLCVYGLHVIEYWRDILIASSLISFGIATENELLRYAAMEGVWDNLMKSVNDDKEDN